MICTHGPTRRHQTTDQSVNLGAQQLRVALAPMSRLGPNIIDNMDYTQPNASNGCT